MSQKNMYFIAGLPRSGSTLLCALLKQNPQIHAEAITSLSSIFASINANWNTIEANIEYPNLQAKEDVLNSVLHGYYKSIEKGIVFDKDRSWVNQIARLEAVLQKQVKMIICVRNPAEILASFERLRRENPLFHTRADFFLKEGSNIASRCFYYAGPDGPLGQSHRSIQDAVTMGYLDRFIFVDYNLFCNTPKSQMKRIYDFFELPSFEHDFENIEQTEVYNDSHLLLPNLHKVKPKLEKTTMNVVSYLGLELFEQYNKHIFWNAWI